MRFWILVVVLVATCDRVPERAIVGDRRIAAQLEDEELISRVAQCAPAR